MLLVKKKVVIQSDRTQMYANLQELLDMETRLMAGGLGGVPNEAIWKKKLKKADNIEEFVSSGRLAVPVLFYKYSLMSAVL